MTAMLDVVYELPSLHRAVEKMSQVRTHTHTHTHTHTALAVLFRLVTRRNQTGVSELKLFPCLKAKRRLRCDLLQSKFGLQIDTHM